MFGSLFYNIIMIASLVCAAVSSEQTANYAVVIDAGSSGNRAFTFKISAGNIEILHRDMMEPGIANYAVELNSVVTVILPLLQSAAEIIPKEEHSKTLFYVQATGGMRLLSDQQQKEIWDALIDGLKDNLHNPFPVHSQHFGTIDGKVEAYYAVMAANYAADRVDERLQPIPGKTMIGALDMGGSSTQMIYHMGGNEVSVKDFWLVFLLDFRL